MFREPDGFTTREFIGLGFWAVLEELHHLKREIHHMALDLTQLQADVAAETTIDQSAIQLLNTLAQELRDSIGDPAALDALASQIEANSANLAAAVAANTAPAPTVPGVTPGANVGQVPVTPEVVDPTNLNNTPADAEPSDPQAAGTAEPTPEPVPEDVPTA